jgi:hypothetical protein
MIKTVKKNLVKKQNAIELMVTEPDLTYKEIAKRVGISRAALQDWRNDPGFIDAYYDRYMIKFGSKLPEVLDAMIREAKQGNVQAGRLVLEHSGKLIKRVAVRIDSPFEKFLNAIEGEVLDVESVENLEDEIKEVGSSPMDIINSIPIKDNLPERNDFNNTPNVRIAQEKKAIKRVVNRSKYNTKKKKKRYNSMYLLRKRAAKVGLELLPPRKPTKTERADWVAKLEELERKPK